MRQLSRPSNVFNKEIVGDASDVTIEGFTTPRSSLEEKRKAIERNRLEFKRQVKSFHNSPLINFGNFQDDRRIDVERQIVTRQFVINYTGLELLVVDRLGLPTVYTAENRTSDLPEPCVVVRRDYLFDTEEEAERTLRVFSTIGVSTCSDLNMITRKLSEPTQRFRFGKRLSLEYLIPAQMLELHPEGIYHQKLDLVFSYVGNYDIPKHPFSADYFPNLNEKFPAGENESDLNIKIRYYSTDVNASTKFINIADTVYELVPNAYLPPKNLVTNRGKHGVTLTTPDAYIEFITMRSSDPNQGVSVRMSLDEANEAYGLFDSRADAEYPKLTHDKRLQVLSDEVADIQATSKLKIISLQQEIDQLKLEGRVGKFSNSIESEMAREAREQSIHVRKMQTENTKQVFGIVSSLIAVVPLIIKFKKELDKS
jgi:hypothetical protein